MLISVINPLINLEDSKKEIQYSYTTNWRNRKYDKKAFDTIKEREIQVVEYDFG